LEGILVPEDETIESGLFCRVKYAAEGRRVGTAVGQNFNIFVLILALRNNFDTARTTALEPSWENCVRIK
jgi:hypothetical protein